jgi:hypothetical protein
MLFISKQFAPKCRNIPMHQSLRVENLRIQGKLLAFIRIFVIPFGAFFTLWLFFFLTLKLVNNPQVPVTKDAIDLFMFGSAFLAVFLAGTYAIVITVFDLFRKAPSPTKALSKRISKAMAYDLKSISKSATITTLSLAVVFIVITLKTTEFLHFMIASTLLLVSMVLMNLSEGIIDERSVTSFLLQEFSDEIEKSVKSKNSYLLSSRDFKRAFKTFDKTLPRAVYTASLEKRAQQIELLLCFGKDSDLSTLSKHIQSVAQSLERNYLEGFDKEYLNLVNFLDTFVETKKGVVDFVQETPLKEKLEKETGTILKEILVKTVPILISIGISVLIYLWLGLQFKPF